MRYYLDTNMLVFILSGDNDNIEIKIRDILYDFSNILYASSIAVNELILLYKIGKIKLLTCKSVQEILDRIEKSGIEIKYYGKHHISQYVNLELLERHKDVNDHGIIAQAISDKIPLISSDKEFKNYIPQGLNFIFNKR